MKERLKILEKEVNNIISTKRLQDLHIEVLKEQVRQKDELIRQQMEVIQILSKCYSNQIIIPTNYN